jgi:membrane-associated protease RseP (regulator of RpoE activity)
MRFDRIVLAASAVLVAFGPAIAQDPASRPASAPAAAETKPSGAPAEVRARHPRIGIRCDAAALEKEHVARVDAVTAGSPAEKAGVKVGDVILKVAGEAIRDDKTYRDILSRKRPGDSVALVLRRGGDELNVEVALVDKLPRTEPESVMVQHVLIAFGDRASTPAGKKRTLEEARKIAEDVLSKAKNGADFDALVKTYSEDAGSVSKTPAGSYTIMQDGKPKPTADARAWSEWVPGFSALSFALEVGDVAMTTPDPELSPFGFHVIKRVK